MRCRRHRPPAVRRGSRTLRRTPPLSAPSERCCCCCSHGTAAPVLQRGDLLLLLLLLLLPRFLLRSALPDRLPSGPPAAANGLRGAAEAPLAVAKGFLPPPPAAAKGLLLLPGRDAGGGGSDGAAATSAGPRDMGSTLRYCPGPDRTPSGPAPPPPPPPPGAGRSERLRLAASRGLEPLPFKSERRCLVEVLPSNAITAVSSAQ